MQRTEKYGMVFGGRRRSVDGIFQIQMLGGFTIRYGNRETAVNGRSKKPYLLLAFLILERSRPVPLEELAGLLWPLHSPDAGAPNALKALLHRVRTSLDQLGEGMGRALLLNREGRCQWNPEVSVDLDVERFQRLCRQAASACEERLDLSLEALALYQGELLPDLIGHPWAAAKAEAPRRSYLQTVLNALPLLGGQSRWTEAAELSGRALKLAPGQEELCRWRMKSLLRLGRRDEAAQVYETFQERLLAKVGVIPSDSLRALYREVRRDLDPRTVSPVTLLERLREPPRPGALLCEYDFFRIICHSMVRMAGRSGEPLHVALISVVGAENTVLPRHSLDRCMDNLQEIILSHLRQGDAAARCSASQFVLLLPQASYENGRQICQRINRAFSRRFPHSPASLRASVQSLLANPS